MLQDGAKVAHRYTMTAQKCVIHASCGASTASRHEVTAAVDGDDPNRPDRGPKEHHRGRRLYPNLGIKARITAQADAVAERGMAAGSPSDIADMLEPCRGLR
jgi:hypothetical protein